MPAAYRNRILVNVVLVSALGLYAYLAFDSFA
jgi:hypothetical protein